MKMKMRRQKTNSGDLLWIASHNWAWGDQKGEKSYLDKKTRKLSLTSSSNKGNEVKYGKTKKLQNWWTILMSQKQNSNIKWVL